MRNVNVTFGVILLLASLAGAQSTGSVSVSVTDQGGAMVPGAALVLRNVATNEVHRAETQEGGVFTFSGLQFGDYELTVSKQSFATRVFQSVVVQTGRLTTINAQLVIAATSEKVTVSEAATPLIETESNSLSDTLDTKQVTNLPVVGRSVMSLTFLVPGWAGTGVGSSNGTWDNLPGGAVVSADFDGTPGISNRFRSGGFNYGTTVVSPRIEDVGEMTISTAQVDLSGNGTAAMRISVVQRHGTNQFHGRLFEDFRNTSLNANSWSNNARGLKRNIIKLNDFGGSIGGPIKKDKLFIFGTWSQSFSPLVNVVTTPYILPTAQAGNFTYTTGGVTKTVNVLQLAGAAGFASTVNPDISSQFSKMNGVVGQAVLVPTSDPNIQNLTFQAPRKDTIYYPTIRGDYNMTERQRLYLSYAQTKTFNNLQNPPQWPGGIDPLGLEYVSNFHNNRIISFGYDFTLKPNLINQFHAGFMYQYDLFDQETLGIGADLPNIHRENWPTVNGVAYGQSLYGGSWPRTPISSFYPMLSANDSLNWQHGTHSVVFGGNWYREQDHYWNGPGGEPNLTLGIANGDPVANVFTSGPNALPGGAQAGAEALYAILTGRISSGNIQVGRPLDPATKQYAPFGAYNLDEVQGSFGLFAQDRWRLRPNLTLNYGLRMDWVGDDYDVNGGYSTLRNVADIFGPTPAGAIFQPGTLGGVGEPHFVARQHVYSPKTNFSPAVALAWTPDTGDSVLGKLFPKNKTVIRTGVSLRHYQEGAQNFWAFASNSGAFFFQSGSLTANSTPATGNFAPGSLSVGNPLPPYLLTPAVYAADVPGSGRFGSTYYGFNTDIKQPYVEQWNFGVQRQIGSGSVFEARYIGNLSLHQWLAEDVNEVNIFENGFLNEFRHAQANLAINIANGKGNSFANNGLTGQFALPILSAAFTGQTAAAGFASSTFVTNLQQGAAGAMANSIAGNATFFCNMVGTAAFSTPCTSRGVSNAPGAGYPINFFQVNPYATGRNAYYLDASGHTNYHALQLEFRQRPTAGFQFNVNYTLAHSLGIASQDGIQGMGNNIYYSDRNFRLNYGPSLFDIRHVVHASGTYDLPFGKGRHFLNQGGVADHVIGGWSIGTIIGIQTGTPSYLGGGVATVNNYPSNTAGGDSGVAFMNGATASQLQSSVGVYRNGNPWVYAFDPSKYVYLPGTPSPCPSCQFQLQPGAANQTVLAPNGYPGTPGNVGGVWGYRPILWGPSWYNIDLSINKSIPIHERYKLVLQGEMLNATNHPTFALGNTTITSTTFGQMTGGPSGPRVVEFRFNIEF